MEEDMVPVLEKEGFGIRYRIQAQKEREVAAAERISR
jgi:hypothetical protein